MKKTKKKISKTLTGKYIGEKSPNYGKKQSLETRLKRSKSLSGKNHYLYGKHRSEKTKRKISESNKGRISSMKDKYHTEETRQKIREQRAKNPPDLLKRRRRKIEMLKQKYLMEFQDLIWYLYFDQRKSLAQIAEIIDMSRTHTKRLFKELGFKARNSRESHLGKKQSKELIEKRVRAIMASLCVKPNRKELELLDLFRENDLPYKFVGDGKFWIEGKNPDFINTNHQKSLVELFGDYWHRGDDGEERKEIFARYGYRTLIIWEHELDNKQTLLERVKLFEESD